mgnify:CR=1 FL=1
MTDAESGTPRPRRRSSAPPEFDPAAYAVMPEPDDRTVTLCLCDIMSSGAGVEVLDTIHLLPKKTRRQGRLPATWFQRVSVWAFQRLQAREEAEGITFRRRPGYRIKMIMDGVEFYFRPGAVAAGVRSARREIASPQLRML